MTVNKLIEQYLDLKTNLAVSTKENYTQIYEKNIKDTKLGKSKVKDIKKMEGVKWNWEDIRKQLIIM